MKKHSHPTSILALKIMGSSKWIRLCACCDYNDFALSKIEFAVFRTSSGRHTAELDTHNVSLSATFALTSCTFLIVCGVNESRCMLDVVVTKFLSRESNPRPSPLTEWPGLFLWPGRNKYFSCIWNLFLPTPMLGESGGRVAPRMSKIYVLVLTHARNGKKCCFCIRIIIAIWIRKPTPWLNSTLGSFAANTCAQKSRTSVRK